MLHKVIIIGGGVAGISASKRELCPFENPMILDFLKGIDRKKYDQGSAWQNPL